MSSGTADSLGGAAAEIQRLDFELQVASFLCALPANIHMDDVARDVIQSRFAAKTPLALDRGMRCCFSKASYHTDDILEYRHIQHVDCSVPDRNSEKQQR